MDSNVPQSKSLPSNLTTARRHRVSISASGSHQSHLFGPIRTHSEQISLDPTDSGKDYLHLLEGGLTEQTRSRVGRLGVLQQFVTDPVAFLSDDLRRIRSGHVWRPRVLLTLYCCLCIIFLTVKIHAFCWNVLEPQHHPPPVGGHAETHARVHSTSTSLTNISLSQRLSVAFRELSPQAHLDTFVLQAQTDHTYASDITACLWIEDDDRVEDTLMSARTWPGPVSLVVVTPHAPNSTRYQRLRDRLLATTKAIANVGAHILYVPSVAGASSNAYLNMARFFSPAGTVSSRVVLFPDGRIPQPALGRTRWLDKLPAPGSTAALRPVLLGNTTQRTVAVLDAPVVLPRDHPVWCTERFYLFGSRALDWEECLWRLWLESAGEVSSIAVPHLWDGSENASVPPSVPSHAMKIRLRWSAKYRSETCAFTLKRSQALESLSKTEKRHVQWRKKFCRETIGPSGALDMH